MGERRRDDLGPAPAGSRRARLLLGLVLAVAAVGHLPAAGAQKEGAQGSTGDWKVIARKQGIVVSTREVAGRDLPVFRGVGVVEANVFEVLAVLEDVPRHTEWMERCNGAKFVDPGSETDHVIYNRTDSPWPADDRDVVLQVHIAIDAAVGRVESSFRSTTRPDMPPVDGVVRMPRLQGRYLLLALDEKRTKVIYIVDADPGGWLPDWLIALVTEDLPLHTIENLRTQVKKRRSAYAAQVTAWRQAHPMQYDR